MIPVTPLITLTTDLGEQDGFIGSMKGVIIGINPSARIVDISHDVPPQDIEAGAYVIKEAYKLFPKLTIHVVVVDPGVGGPRKPLLAVSQNYYFIAPDNGVLSYVYKEEGSVRVYELSATHYFRPSPGRTFHGRDIFAPIAAWLSKGVSPDNLGKDVEGFVTLTLPHPVAVAEKTMKGRVAYIDRFGNLITTITKAHLDELFLKSSGKTVEVKVKEVVIKGLSDYYGQGEKGTPSALVNSSGYLEIFCHLGSARDILKAGRGDDVTLTVL